MEADGLALTLRSRSVVGVRKIGVGSGVTSRQSLQVRAPWRCGAAGGRPSLGCLRMDGLERRELVTRHGSSRLKVVCSSYKKAEAVIESEHFNAIADEALILKKKAEEIAPQLNGQCIFFVGMMGSGKTTVGKLLSEALAYSFFDSDKLVEQAVGATSVAQIFKQHSEAFFRDNESKVLRDLSLMHQLVVATGGGAVIRPINWRHMKKGITVWLDVPLDALARRIAAVGTASRPLLHEESGDAYTKAFLRLSALAEERGEAYSNADVRVSLQYLADKQGHRDVSALTPTAIATESVERIGIFLIEKTMPEEQRSLKDAIRLISSNWSLVDSLPADHLYNLEQLSGVETHEELSYCTISMMLIQGMHLLRKSHLSPLQRAWCRCPNQLLEQDGSLSLSKTQEL